MFTGLIQDIGQIRSYKDDRGGKRIEITTALPLADIDMGASIACAGVCLTVVEKGENWFAVEASQETLTLTSVKHWHKDLRINLEPSLKLGDEMGGHMVYGHVDGIGQIKDIIPEGDYQNWWFQAPKNLMPFFAVKGSVSIDGTSLTINWVSEDSFGITLIPHTLSHTHFGQRQIGDHVNLEVDMLARYVQRLQEFSHLDIAK